MSTIRVCTVEMSSLKMLLIHFKVFQWRLCTRTFAANASTRQKLITLPSIDGWADSSLCSRSSSTQTSVPRCQSYAVGNDFICGVSGGERKRVSIAEAVLRGSLIQCWDNSTRGLDSATALEFVKTLRISASLAGSTAIVAIYQAICDVCNTMCIPRTLLTEIGLRQGCCALRG